MILDAFDVVYCEDGDIDDDIDGIDGDDEEDDNEDTKLYSDSSSESEIDLNLSLLKKQKKKSMAYALYRLFSCMWSENYVIKPRQIKKVVTAKMDFFSGYSQHDSSEFLIKLFDILENELKIPGKIKNIKIFNDEDILFTKKYNKLQKDIVNELDSKEKIKLMQFSIELKKNNFRSFVKNEYIEMWEKYVKTTNSIIMDLFGFGTMTQTQCLKCENLSCRFEVNNMLQLSLTQSQDSIELTDLLKSECSIIEKLTGDNMYRCDTCSDLQEANKISHVWQFPEILIIHLKRFECKFVNMTNQMVPMTIKINTNVKFPLEGLDMREFMSEYNDTNIDNAQKPSFTINLQKTIIHTIIDLFNTFKFNKLFK